MEDFEAIYVQYFDSVYKYVFSLRRNDVIAEEITQEAFYKAMGCSFSAGKEQFLRSGRGYSSPPGTHTTGRCSCPKCTCPY